MHLSIEHPLGRSLRPGSTVYGLAMIGFGLVGLVRLDAIPALEPVSASFPMRPLVGILSAILLMGVGTLFVADRQTSKAAICAGAFFSYLILSLHAPYLAAHPLNGGAWVGAFEVLAMNAMVWMLAATLILGGPVVTHGTAWRRVGLAARLAFGICLVAFGLSHFVYHQYVESVIPAWIPLHPFWTYGLGIAFIAAGASISTDVKASLAAALLAVMWGSWVFIVHLPRVAANPTGKNEWTSLFVAVAMCGGSWVVSVCVARLRHAVEPLGVSGPRLRSERNQLASF